MHALDSVIYAVHGKSIGSRHDEQIRIDAGIYGCFDLRDHFVAWNHLLA